jgi:predicted NUDIX family phosphoesterase
VTTDDDERVRVVPRAALPDAAGWHGVVEGDLEALVRLVGEAGRDLPRAEMEQDASFKQIIPYLVVRDGRRYFLMRRTRAGGDQRLHDRWSIGVGGHLNPGDAGVHDGLLREWREEIDAPFTPEFRFVGLLNDDTTPVGSVHLGVVFEADAGGRPVAIRELDKLSGSFAEPAEVRAVADRLETWSALVFEHLESIAEGRTARMP